jgi:hypothetical protein
MSEIKTVVTRGSELSRLAYNIMEMREPEAVAEYQDALRKYNRRRRGRAEVTRKFTEESGPMGMFASTTKRTGFEIKRMGGAEFVERPKHPYRRMWSYLSYAKGAWKSGQGGLLANGGKYNRPVSPQRVEKYSEAMQAGEWQDLLSDPITITADGEVINGQHRLAAAADVDWSKAPNDPRFLVVTGADPAEIHFADKSKRTGNDVAVIAEKALKAAS